MKTRYPSYDPSQVVIFTGDLANQLFNDVRRLSNLVFSRDFQVTENNAGTLVNLVGTLRPKTLKVTAYATAGGIYKCKGYQGFPYIDPTVDMALPQTNETLPATFDCYLENVPEINIPVSHWLEVGANVIAVPTSGQTTTDNLPIYRAYVGPPPLWGKVTTVWVPGTNVIGLTPCDSTGALVSGASELQVVVEFPVAFLPQYCAYILNDVIPYLYIQNADGTWLPVLLRNKLPALAQYQGWYGTILSGGTSVTIVPDYTRAS